MNINLKTAITAVAGVVVVGVSAGQSIHTHRTEKAKRREIKNNMLLDTRAIELARDEMTRRISNGDYPLGSLSRLQHDMQTEIDFQKIAIREEF